MQKLSHSFNRWVRFYPSFIILFIFASLVFSTLAQNSQASDSGVYIKLNPKEKYIEDKDPITIEFFVSALENGKVVYSDIAVTITTENETKTLSVFPNTKQRVTFSPLPRGIYLGEATAQWDSYYVTRKFDILVLPAPIPYTAQFLNFGERFWFHSKSDLNFTIIITGYKGREAIPITTWVGNGSFEYYIQSQPPIWEPNREWKLKYDLVEVEIFDINGWYCYENGQRSYMWSYRPIEPYESLMFFNVGIIVIIVAVFIMTMKRFLGKRIKEVEE